MLLLAQLFYILSKALEYGAIAGCGQDDRPDLGVNGDGKEEEMEADSEEM
jgi:hypothetical protein